MPPPFIASEGVKGPPQFIRSVVRPLPGHTPGVDPAVAAVADRHGYEEPGPPPGTDPRLWCVVHHCAMRFTGPRQNRRVTCPRCVPAVRTSESVPFGLRCAALGCAVTARWDLYGVPVCGARCVERIGAGGGVRPRACALRVVTYRCETGWIVLACFPNGRHKARRGEADRSLRLQWWLPTATFPRNAVLRWPARGRERRLLRTTVLTDPVLAQLFRQLARCQVAEARPLVRAIIPWERGLSPRPWLETTLEPVLARVAERRRAYRAARGNGRPIRQSI